MFKLLFITTLLAFAATNVTASQLTNGEEIEVCKMGFAAVNSSPIEDYQFLEKTDDTLLLKSKKYNDYRCEIFSDGQVVTLSTPSWGRIKPTGNIKKVGKCIQVKLYDPGFGIEHNLNSCK